jgi:hypothetical protein
VKTGIITGESISDYHAADAFSASKLKVFRRLPALYYATYIAKTLPAKPPTDAIDVGNAVDCLLLEGTDEYAKRVYVLPSTYSGGRNADKALVASKQAAGLTVITQEEAGLVEEMCQAVFRNPDASALLEHVQPATTFRFDYGFAHGQCRPDWFNPEGCVLPSTGEHTGPYWIELKSAASLHKGDFFTFQKAYTKFHYHLQLPFYREVMADVLAGKTERPRPLLMVVDKTQIPYCQIFNPLATERGRDDFDLGTRRVMRDIFDLQRCYETGVWPGLPQRIQPIELSYWDRKALEEGVEEAE